jgi:hypothetical protein
MGMKAPRLVMPTRLRLPPASTVTLFAPA